MLVMSRQRMRRLMHKQIQKFLTWYIYLKIKLFSNASALEKKIA